MAMGKRKQLQQELFLAADILPRSAGHPFYQKLNLLLAEAGFDRWIENRCQQYYEEDDRRGQPSIPPGMYFRMLLVGYFEDIESQRGIAWRCSDSFSLREFLGVPLGKNSPDHSTLSNTRKRLPAEVSEGVFQFVLQIANGKQLLSGKTVGVDSTLLEANAAMKSIVRRDTGEDWQTYVTKLMHEQGEIAEDHEPTSEEVRRFDKSRKDKRVSNDDWVAKTDADACIAKLKNGATHMAYKAEHVVDLESDLVLAAEILPANLSDQQTLIDSVVAAQVNLDAAKCEVEIEAVVADKGYHKASTLELADQLNLRTYIAEPKRPHDRRWKGRPPAQKSCVYNNRRRLKRAKGKLLQRRRSELVERTFAHICNSGGARRTWLRSLVNVKKRYLIAAAAHNLGRILFKLLGVGKPRALQSGLLAKTLFAALAQLAIRLHRAAFQLHTIRPTSKNSLASAINACHVAA